MSVAGEVPLGDLEQYRPYLRLLAGMDVDARLQGKLDPSGVVQQTLWEAHLDRDRIKRAGEASETVILEWLRRLLLRNLLDELRRLGRTNANLARERSLEESSAHLAAELAASDFSPSAHAARNERAFRLAEALEQLPLDPRGAVVRHHIPCMPLSGVALEMGRSKEAVAGLLHRGLV